MNCEEIKNSIKERIKLETHTNYMLSAMNGNVDKLEHVKAMIIKQVHSIEKGLSMENIRLGFGIARINSMLYYLDLFLKSGGDPQIDECKMAKSVLLSYFELHDNAGWQEKVYIDIKKKASNLTDRIVCNDEYGGTLTLNKKDYFIDSDMFKTLVLSRHSIRSFNGQHVDESVLKKALELAIHAPSACNRQPTRVYILDHKDFELIDNWTGGVKTFIDQVDKLLIITSQMAAFEKDEYYQYTVSAGIFVGYLTLSLHAYGIGNCVLQRALINNGTWDKIKKKAAIPLNEQSVCAIAIGIPNEITRVPLSNRLSYDRIVKTIEAKKTEKA